MRRSEDDISRAFTNWMPIWEKYLESDLGKDSQAEENFDKTGVREWR